MGGDSAPTIMPIRIANVAFVTVIMSRYSFAVGSADPFDFTGIADAVDAVVAAGTSGRAHFVPAIAAVGPHLLMVSSAVIASAAIGLQRLVAPISALAALVITRAGESRGGHRQRRHADNKLELAHVKDLL